MAAIEQISIKANIFSKNTLEILWMLTNIACSRRNVNPLKMPPPPVLSGKVSLKCTNRYLAKDIDPRVIDDHATIEQIQNHTNCSTLNTRTMVSTREEVGNGRCKDEDKKNRVPTSAVSTRLRSLILLARTTSGRLFLLAAGRSGSRQRSQTRPEEDDGHRLGNRHRLGRRFRRARRRSSARSR